tara:strand:+ start:45625 stop:48369 length:2745 start_codon:yes stop_codon:yes gene_type:complete
MKRSALALSMVLSCFPLYAVDVVDSNANISELNAIKSKILTNPNEQSLRVELINFYYKQGNIQEALNELTKVKQSNANIAIWGMIAAKLYLATQHYEDAMTVLHELNAEEHGVERSLLLGDTYLALGEFSAAQKTFEAITEPHIGKSLGLARIALIEQNSDAAQTYLDGIPRDIKDKMSTHEDSKVHTLQAEIYRQQKKWDQAGEEYQSAIKLSAKNVIAQIQYTSLLWGQKNKAAFKKLAMSSYQKAPTHPRAMYYAAIAYLEDNNTAEALKILNQGTTLHPNFSQNYLLLGRVYFDEGKLLLAEQNVKAYLKLNTNSSMATKLLAAVQLRLNRVKEAVVLLSELEDSHAEDSGFLALYGTALLLNQDVGKAQPILIKAQDLGATHPAVTTELALSHLQQGNKAQGHALLQKLVDENTQDIQADVLLVLSLVDEQSYSSAIKTAENIVKKRPEHPAAYNLMGMIYEQTEKLVLAKQYYQKALEKDPSFVLAQNNLSELYLKQGRYSDAEQNLKLTLKKNSSELRAQLLMALLKEKTGHEKSAIKWFERAKSSHPKVILPRAQYVEHFLRKGDFKQANSEADNLYRQFPQSIQVLALVGKLKVMQGKHQEGYKLYKDWQAVDKNNAFVSYMLAKISIQLNNIDEAREHVHQTLSLNDKYIPALILQAELLTRAQDLTQALSVAQHILSIAPHSGFAHQLLGKIYYLQENKRKSLDHFQRAFDLDPSMENVVNVYKLQVASDELKAGLQLLEDWAQARPNHIGIRRYLAAQYLDNQLNDKAIAYYEDIIKRTTSDFVTYNNLAVLNLPIDLDKAYQYAQKAYKLSPNQAKVADTLGWVLVKRGQPEKGLPLLEQARDLTPNDLDIQYHLAQALYMLGAKEQAVKILEKGARQKAEYAEQSQALALLDKIQLEMSE